jgi:hypothetical protein
MEVLTVGPSDAKALVVVTAFIDFLVLDVLVVDLFLLILLVLVTLIDRLRI